MCLRREGNDAWKNTQHKYFCNIKCNFHRDSSLHVACHNPAHIGHDKKKKKMGNDSNFHETRKDGGCFVSNISGVHLDLQYVDSVVHGCGVKK